MVSSWARSSMRSRSTVWSSARRRSTSGAAAGARRPAPPRSAASASSARASSGASLLSAASAPGAQLLDLGLGILHAQVQPGEVGGDQLGLRPLGAAVQGLDLGLGVLGARAEVPELGLPLLHRGCGARARPRRPAPPRRPRPGRAAPELGLRGLRARAELSGVRGGQLRLGGLGPARAGPRPRPRRRRRAGRPRRPRCGRRRAPRAGGRPPPARDRRALVAAARRERVGGRGGSVARLGAPRARQVDDDAAADLALRRPGASASRPVHGKAATQWSGDPAAGIGQGPQPPARPLDLDDERGARQPAADAVPFPLHPQSSRDWPTRSGRGSNEMRPPGARSRSARRPAGPTPPGPRLSSGRRRGGRPRRRGGGCRGPRR